MFDRGQIVLVKMRTYPWWPAVIINQRDCKRPSTSKNKQWVFWFGDHQVSQVEQKYVVDFKLSFKEKWNPKLSPRYKRSVHEVLVILASRYDVAQSDPSALLKWALNGFPTRLRLRTEEPKKFDLPAIVMKALKKCSNPRHESSKQKSAKDSENKIDKVFEGARKDRISVQEKVVEDVRKDRKSQEDVCIICLTEEEVVMCHPIFVGGSCKKCKKSVVKIIKCARGVMHVICVLCGEGGKLVYCCNPGCQSAYCDVCLDFLTPKGTFSKILKNDNWECYICKPDHAKGNLIRKRETRFSMQRSPSMMGEEKLPIRVLSLSDAALTVLKMKKILVELFCTEPIRRNKQSPAQDWYDDFTKEEIFEIRPDFMYGSYVPADGAVDKKKNSEAFFVTFYRFVFRLLTAQLAVPDIFFMIMTEDGVLDPEMKLRVTRFTERDPVIIQLPTKKMCLWTNIPDIKGVKDQKCSMKMKTAFEEGVLKKFLDPLKTYFKLEK